MGLRGIGAQTLKARQTPAKPRRKVLPWQKPGLSRLQRVVAFLHDLKVTSGKLAGRRFRLRPWQLQDLAAIYHENRGRRPVRTAVLSVARKNGKTQLAAALALCHLVGPEAEPRGEVYSCANDRFQAGKIFNEMVAILKVHPELGDRVNVIRFQKTIETLSGDGEGSSYTALSADAYTKHGLSPSFVVYDELGQAKSRDLFDALDTAMGARDDPLMVVISTQAADDDAPMSELIDYGAQVKAGDVQDPSFYLSLFTAPEGADPWSPATWALANPALGDFRSLDDVQRLASQARSVLSKEPAFRNLVLNQRIDAAPAWLPRSVWMAVEAPLQLEDYKKRECWCGLDMSFTTDLTALAIVFPNGPDRFDAFVEFWRAREGLADASVRDAKPYELWARQGHLRLTEGKVIKLPPIAKRIGEIAADFVVKNIAFDRYRHRELAEDMSDLGITVPMIEHPQGFRRIADSPLWMPGSFLALQNAIIEQHIRVAANPVMRANVAAVAVRQDPAGTDNAIPDKRRARGRIDGVTALSMAIGAAGARKAVEREAEYQLMVFG